MEWLNGYKMKTVLVGCVAVVVLGGGSANADFTFGEPTNLGPTINSSSGDSIGCFSSDGLEMYLVSARPDGYGNWDIWVARRPTIDDDWGEPENLGPKVNGSQTDACPSMSFDGLELYFNSTRPGGYGDWDIWMTTRETRDAEWGTPVNLGPIVNSSFGDGQPWISSNDLELYFNSWRSDGFGKSDIWVTTRATKDDPWGEPVNLGAVVNSSFYEGYQCTSADGLSLLFSEQLGAPWRPGGFGRIDMWVTTRTSVNDPWRTPVNLGPVVNTSSHDSGPRISPDGSMLYFGSERPGGFGGTYGDIYQAPIISIVDLNGDGTVDASDMCIMVDYWGTDEPVCDIGPMPWGDGVVDVEDLKVFAEHLFEEVDDPTLIAHWPLDGAQGVIAYDNAAENDGALMGGPVWQADGGAVVGALQFDGIDDYVSTNPVLNPANGVISVVAWVMGGAPGQVVLSQADGVDWLCADSVGGNLMTGLGPPAGRLASPPLISESTITDGNWHRIAFVWDGSHRALYIDDILVAEDTQPGLSSAVGGLNIGCGSDSAAGTFWAGLIDDVRIYNRALIP